MDNPFVMDVLIPTIAKITRYTGRPAKTRSLALRTQTPYSTIQFYLSKAVDAGDIVRVGVKRGYVLPDAKRSAWAWWEGLVQLAFPFLQSVKAREGERVKKRRGPRRVAYQSEWRQLELPFAWVA